MLKGVITLVQVNVVSSNVEQALKNLKRKLQREGVFRVIKLKRYHETSSEEKQRKSDESFRRRRKVNRKRYQED